MSDAYREQTDGKPERMFVDAHIHLDRYPPDELTSMLERFEDIGGAAVVAVSMDRLSSVATRRLALQYPGAVVPAYGFHPEQPPPSAEEADALIEWIRQRAAAGERFAIGEVGLPYYTRHESVGAGRPFDEAPYLRLLERFIALAAELDKPLVLHAVYEDADKACDILDRYAVRRVHFHWFKGALATIERMIEAGYCISVTPDVRYEPEIRELAGRYPLGLMMSETDGPWPFEGPYAGRDTEPAMVLDVVREIARIKKLPFEQVTRQLYDNAAAFYGLS
ncbi:TatD family hydrolase [Paenibacillus thailandensis]|uniref:TatD family hydrolase n=1 Tax=Paenibacillus thailandensis TaxID=393250 RepID=A0ABW5QY25_9BACL